MYRTRAYLRSGDVWGPRGPHLQLLRCRLTATRFTPGPASQDQSNGDRISGPHSLSARLLTEKAFPPPHARVALDIETAGSAGMEDYQPIIRSGALVFPFDNLGLRSVGRRRRRCRSASCPQPARFFIPMPSKSRVLFQVTSSSWTFPAGPVLSTLSFGSAIVAPSRAMRSNDVGGIVPFEVD